jgi:hypothetical protein
VAAFAISRLFEWNVSQKGRRLFMNRRSITIVVAVVLCAVGFAYGQGWLHWSRPSIETESDKAGIHQSLDQQKVKNVAVPLTAEAPERATTSKK